MVEIKFFIRRLLTKADEENKDKAEQILPFQTLFPSFASVGFFRQNFLRVKVVLEISNLKIQRDGVMILDGVYWRVERGQHWAILGANGSG